MSKKHKRAKVSKFQLVDGKPMHIATQWVLVGSIATVAAIKIIEASVELSLQVMLVNPELASSNFWVALMI